MGEILLKVAHFRYSQIRQLSSHGVWYDKSANFSYLVSSNRQKRAKEFCINALAWVGGEIVPCFIDFNIISPPNNLM